MSDIPDGKAPIVASAAAAWRFFFAHWVEFLPAALMVAIVSGASTLLQVSAGGGGPGGFGAGAIGLALGVAASAMFTAAVLRRAVREEAQGPYGLSFGADEIRLIGVWLSLILMIAPILLLVAFVVFVTVLNRVAGTPAELQALLADPEKFNQAVAEHLGPAGEWALSLFFLLVLAVLVWFAVRLSLVNAATIGERRIIIFQSWSWTNGNFWRVLAALALTALPAVVASYFLLQLLDVLVGATGASPAKVFAIGAYTGFIDALRNIPPLAVAAYLYKGLRPPDFVPK
jgi:hypothetical protein